VDWHNHRRFFEACGDIPLGELETASYRQDTGLTEAN
jgi:hypothetical protein